MKNNSNKNKQTSVQKYSISMASLFLSTLLLLNGVPVVAAAEETQTDAVADVENDETMEIEETEPEETETSEEIESTGDVLEAAAFAAPAPINDSGTASNATDEAPSEGSGEGDNEGEEEYPIISEEVREIAIPFEVEYVEDPTLIEGEEVISQEGNDGVLTQTVQITTHEDGSVEEEIIEETLVEEATPQIVLVGTQVVEEPEQPEEPEEPEIPVVPEPETPAPEPEESEDPAEEDPMLQVDPIFPNAETITGFANPNAQVVVFYPGSSRQRSANVDANGSWIVRNVAGDANYLTEGSTVPMQLIYDDQIHDYDDQFYVQAESENPDDYAAEVEVSDDSSTAENTSNENLSSSNTSETAELLPETGTSDDNTNILGLASLATGLGLMAVGKKKEYKEMN